jgi:asparagine synthase (glutamine-hydrolysing)
MFAFAILDLARARLFCARDRYGEKPFLFSAKNEFFAFASEYKALLQLPCIPLEIDEWRLIRAASNASTGLDADRQTVFSAVEQLLPAEAMTIDVRTLERHVWRYWSVTPIEATSSADEREVFAEFRHLLTDSVRIRMRSDVPVGSCLSGGLDSSAIVCIVRKLLGDNAPYNTFTGRFPGTGADEWGYAKEVVDAANVTSHVVEPSVDGFLDVVPQFIWHNELPVGSSSQFAQWSVFRLAKDHGVIVLLDGQGADETLGGYEQYFRQYIEALRERGESERLARELPAIRRRYPLALTSPRRALRDRLPFGVRHWLSDQLGVGSSMLYGVALDFARELIPEKDPPRLGGLNPLAGALVQDTFGRYLTTLLRYGDRNSMAHSREVRLPFCDHRIAEFVFRQPPHMIMGEVQTKRMLRESMRGLLPEVVRLRWNKQGFRPPQEVWFKSPRFVALVRETLNSTSFRTSPYWKHMWWDRALDRLGRGDVRMAWTMWAPVMVELWKHHFLEPLSADRAAEHKKDVARCA